MAKQRRNTIEIELPEGRAVKTVRLVGEKSKYIIVELKKEYNVKKKPRFSKTKRGYKFS